MKRSSWPAATMLGALVGVVGALAPVGASAEIYAWVDPSGAVTYSNLPPPKDARVIEVIQDIPAPSPQSQAAAEAAHRSEMQALNERVQQVERELQQSRMPAPPPPMPYPSAAPPSYGPPPGYGPVASYGPGCDPEYYDCSSWDGPVYYTVGALPYWPYYRQRGFHHDGFSHGDRFPHGAYHPAHFGGGHFGASMRTSGGHAAAPGPVARAH